MQLPRMTKQKPDPKPAYKDEGVDFTENFKREKAMIFKAATLQPWVDSIVQQCFPQLLESPEKKFVLTHLNKVMTLEMATLDPWYFGQVSLGLMCPFPIGPRTWRRNWQHCTSRQQWTTDRPVTFARLSERVFGHEEVWMSLTPMEVATLRALHKRCKGKVLIGGLGLGYSALRVLQSKKVTHVTVVEQFKPLINVIAPNLKKQFGDRVEFIHGDVWEHLGLESGVRLRDYSTVFLDVWRNYGGNKDSWQFKEVAAVAKLQNVTALAWG